MKVFAVLATSLIAAVASAPAAEKAVRLFEMRTYYAAPGKGHGHK